MERTFDVLHTVVTPQNFTDFMKLSDTEHRAMSFAMMKMIDELKEDLEALKTQPHNDIAIEPVMLDLDVDVIDVDDVASTKEEDATPAKIPTATDDREGSTLGKKIGKTSKYHFVTFKRGMVNSKVTKLQHL